MAICGNKEGKWREWKSWDREKKLRDWFEVIYRKEERGMI
jgi:hypothetical protein